MIQNIINPGDPFTRVHTKTLEDPNLSPTAKWILTYLAGRPPGWQIQITDIVARSTAGKAAIYAGMKELKERGYALFTPERKNGKVVEGNYSVRTSLDIPWPEKLLPDFQDLEKLEVENRDLSNKHKTTKKHCAVAGTGRSLGIKETSFEAILTDRFYKLAIENRWLTPRSKSPLKKWRTAVGQLVADNNHETDIIKKVFDWYVDHHRDPYCPQVRALTTFCGYFQRVVDARRRWLKENPEERGGHWVDDTHQYEKNGKMITKKYRRWELDED